MTDTVLDEPTPAPPTPYRRRRLLVVALVVALLAALAYGGARTYDSAFGVADYSGSGSGHVLVQVKAGDSASDIGATLLSRQVVKSVKAFTRAAGKETRSRGIQPGFYDLRRQMSAAAALARLLDPAARVRGRVTLPEGIPLSVVVDRMVKYTELKRADVVAALENPSVLGLPAFAKNRPEGFLFPATYDVEPGTAAVDALRLMTEKFAEVAAGLDLEARAGELGLSAYEIVTIASIIEDETALDADRGKVARVVLNRLARGMPLQLDSTVNYVRTQKKARLSLDDIRVESPYNTYAHTGLPPTPIDSPGEKALEAALSPAEGDWLYFITIDKAGNSLFTSDYQEFLRAKAKAQREGVY
ncbi:MAG TPA: endolytic transglycosylase MltG [Mycobacteriales bacterium]|nr:endolytic transglycosylase MltG [Mycobacteriales bacterium]